MWRETISEDISGSVVVAARALDEEDFVASMGLKKREKRTSNANGTRRKRTMLEKPRRELDSSPLEGEEVAENVMVFTWSAMTCIRLAWTEFIASLSMLRRYGPYLRERVCES